MRLPRLNNVILETTTKVVSYLILAFAIYLFLAGHNNPGGGFVAGLVTASALVLNYLTFDMETIEKRKNFHFRIMIGIGLLLAVGTGLGGVLFGQAFLTHAFGMFDLPFLGETELATATIFDLGVYFVVVGVTMTIILSIGADE
ncbi:Na(+)/H(+) antiporter subunit B [Rubeoparvulum massiliense]|uniref:Na(+)/H(+) antiporter subunit B n=1 Tax=Rubeoparvulum massiliense TaxID=1631346 RepID=UPI00065E46E4|nr:Na(+)/H(+) antiporter subunit B [Rubeoparvulum massiliense]